MSDIEKRNLIAQWAFDTRPVLGRFHLWLDDVHVDRSQAEPVSSHTFTPRGIARNLAVTAAATALGTKLYGGYGDGAGKDKFAYNQAKKGADAISAYVMSEGLWYLTRTLPEDHAIMVSLGEGLMPKAGETPEMGANPLLGFGRVYARPEVAMTVDRRVRRLLNEPGHTFEQFHGWLKSRGITIWGAAVDTLENTSRFAEGKPTGPMVVFHLFDSPLTVSRPYESYTGCITVPRAVARKAEDLAVLLDYRTPRAKVMEVIQATYPGIRPEHVHVWTLAGKSRMKRLGKTWEAWTAAGAHLVEDGWKAPSGLEVFTDSGTYAPTFLVGSWKDASGAPHVFLCDGYAASAEAMQASSLDEVLDVSSSMAVFSPSFDLPCDQEAKIMQLDPGAPGFAASIRAITAGRPVTRRRGGGLRRGHPRRPELQRPHGQARAAGRQLPPREALGRAGGHRLHVRRPVHRDQGRREGLGGRLPGHHAAGHPQRLVLHHLHVPSHGVVRAAAPRLQPAAGPLPLGRGPHQARREDLRLGAHPQRAPDHVLPGARPRR